MSKKKRISYKSSGVSISRGEALVDLIKPLAKKTKRSEIIEDIGGFAGASLLPKKYKNPILVACTDGVGTKIEIAKKMNVHDSIGIDLVAMCVNDLITLKAEPLFFLDYLVTEKINLQTSKQIIRGIAKGCELANCSLIGGETAEHPNAFPKNTYDLAGFCVGVTEKSKHSNLSKNNDILIGMKSSGLHSNGYSLIRKLLDTKKISLKQDFSQTTLGHVLLKPTKIYVKEILSLTNKVNLSAISHITGGGLTGNLERIIPENHTAILNSPFEYKFNKKLYSLIQEKSNLSIKEMLSTFNCGYGMILSAQVKDFKKISKILLTNKIQFKLIGKVKKTNTSKKVIFN